MPRPSSSDATLCDVADVHDDVPSSSVKNGTRLVPPGLRCAAATSACFASHAALSASKTHSGSAPIRPIGLAK
eukprot:2251852-Pleurochrysis_carterae.AAC.1